MNYFYNIFKIIEIIVPVLVSVAFLTLAERKVLAAMQRRIGPNVVGYSGFLQPIADGIKLIFKEMLFPLESDKKIFFIGPALALSLSFSVWSVVIFDFDSFYVDISASILLCLAITSLNFYSVLIAGWSSNSVYSFLGAIRSSAQMISYEVFVSVVFICVFVISSSINICELVELQKNLFIMFLVFPMFFVFFASMLAETSRTPFDLPEAEGELVAGYNVEYSSIGFVFFFIAEYMNIIFSTFFVSIIFFGGYNFFGASLFFIIIKSIFFLFLFIWIRAALPRYRYDQLMRLGWKVFLPFTFGYVVFILSIIWL